MVEIEGMIKSQHVSILIDLGASLSYISPRIIELCKFVPEKCNHSINSSLKEMLLSVKISKNPNHILHIFERESSKFYSSFST